MMFAETGLRSGHLRRTSVRLQLIESDARNVAADVQFVKHFDGLIGGAELALDNAVGGLIQQALDSLEQEGFGRSCLIQVPGAAPIKSSNLLLVGLGRIERFTVQNLQIALINAMRKSLKNDFITIATPVMGISREAGLPMEEAYTVTLYSIVSALADFARQHGVPPRATDITIFDHNSEQVSTFVSLSSGVLDSLGVEYATILDRLFYIDLTK
jgi:hypothetical protein